MAEPLAKSPLFRLGKLHLNQQPAVDTAKGFPIDEAEDAQILRLGTEVNINQLPACHFEARGTYFVPNAKKDKARKIIELVKNWKTAEDIFAGVDYQRSLGPDPQQPANAYGSALLQQGTNHMQYFTSIHAFEFPNNIVFEQRLVPVEYIKKRMPVKNLDDDGDEVTSPFDVLRTFSGRIEIAFGSITEGDELVTGALIYIQFDAHVLRQYPNSDETVVPNGISCNTAAGNSAMGALPGSVASHIKKRLKNIAKIIEED